MREFLPFIIQKFGEAYAGYIWAAPFFRPRFPGGP